MEQNERPIFQIDFEGGESASLPLNLLQTSIFPVVLIKDDRIRTLGTCFAISNHGLCMTAKHVIDEVPRIIDPHDERHGTVDGMLGVLYLSTDVPDDHPTDLLGGFIPMATVKTIDSLDIAVMHLNLPVNTETGELIRFPVQRLRLDFPKRGERLLALGYEKGEWVFDEPGIHTLSHTFTASTGFAGALHPARRDSVLMPTPCFQTSAPFRSGMSGGPVIAQDGWVVGVISTGFDVAEGEEAISYATPIAPSMGMSLRGRDSAGNERALFLWDFADGGAIVVDAGSAMVASAGDQILIEVGGCRYTAVLGV